MWEHIILSYSFRINPIIACDFCYFKVQTHSLYLQTLCKLSSSDFKSIVVFPRRRRRRWRIHRGEALCSTYLSLQGPTAAEPEAIAVLQTCLPSHCPQDDTRPSPPSLCLARLSSAQLSSLSAIAAGNRCHPSITSPDDRPAGSHSSHSLSAFFFFRGSR